MPEWPKSAWEPPAATPARSLTESTKASPPEFLTHAEKSGFQETGRYAESVEFANRLAARSPFVKVLKIGKTPQGRDLLAVVVSKDRAFTPELARKTGKPVILLQNGIHAGEIAGKDASNMLLRDLVITKRLARLLDHVIVINIPVFNVDGHENVSEFHRVNQQGPREMGFRATSQRLNLNRDYVKADAPEMRAWLELFRNWLPDFFIDNHVTDGADYQYDLTVSISAEPELWPSVGSWVRNVYTPEVERQMAKDGHVMAPYGGLRDPRDPSKGFVAAFYSPRFSHAYTAAQHRPGLLVETHSLKKFRTRVWAHYDIMLHTLETIASDPASLKTAVRNADRDAAMAASFVLAGRVDTSAPGEPFTYRGLTVRQEASAVSGGRYAVYGGEPVNTETQIFRKFASSLELRVPAAYAIPKEWSDVATMLATHGVRTEVLTEARTVDADTLRFSGVQWSGQPFEGRLMTSFQVAATRDKKKTIPAGTILVPMNQRASRIAMHLLEPEAPDSLVRWGFLNAIFEQKEYFSDYVFEPIAKAMLDRDPKLKEQFETSTKDLAPRAKLNWLYERSPYFEAEKNVYPILRIH